MRHLYALNRVLVYTAATTMFVALAIPVQVQAQDVDDGPEADAVEEIVVTGTRIKNPNVIAASPVTTIGIEEISLKQTPNIERIFRDLPITIPGDGENVNNGTSGQATLDLRGLGPARSLILIDGKRLAPYDINGIVTTDVIPVNMVKRVDIVTGGASAVYGSDAMSGAVNFIMRDDFEGFELELAYSVTDSSEAFAGGGEDTTYINALFGVAFDDDRGHIVIGGGHTERGAVLLGERTFGLFGVSSTTGAGLGAPPAEPTPDCSGNTSFTVAHSTASGSGTSIPGTLDLFSGSRYQFRDDMSIAPFTAVGADTRCALFNFNPFNYYQKPQERWQATTIASYDFNDNVEFYARASFSANESAFQIAPSGTFGQPFTIPVMNPFFTDATRTTIIADLNTGAATFVAATQAEIVRLQAIPNPTQDDLVSIAGLQDVLAADPLGFNTVGIQDLNGDGVFDTNDEFTSTARRRTLELGPRTGIFDTDYFQYVLGVRGSLPGRMEGWNYDVSYQRGESDFVETRDGFTNRTNLQAGINTVDPNRCISARGVVTGAPCTPINVFGPLGSITDAQRDSGFFIAIASDLRKATQTIYHASIAGTIDSLSLPSADDGLSVAFGLEHSDLSASSNPDECLKQPPSSCQGGAVVNRFPVEGKYSSDEFFVEAILPLVQGKSGFENLSLEVGYRGADYDVQGTTDSWKVGISWEIIPGFRFRAMEQQAVRVPNVGELFSPIRVRNDFATFDPCSIGNPNPPASGSTLFNLCVNSGTGMLPSQVGMVPDLDFGDLPVFFGANPDALPGEEEASTTTFGFVWELDLFAGTTFSVDYYDITIDDYIGFPSGQEALDLCYVLQDPVTCGGIVRVAGALVLSGAGVPAHNRNLVAYEAEGIDLIVNTGFEAGNVGEFALALTAHQYLTNQFQTTAVSAIVDCKGHYGFFCNPVPEFRHTLRISWIRDNLDASLLWRHIGEMDAEPNQAADLFPEFRSVDAQNYLDLTFGFAYKDFGRISFLVANIMDEDPPILGVRTGTTASNNGNTFPSLFDTMGRVYSVNLKLTF